MNETLCITILNVSSYRVNCGIPSNTKIISNILLTNMNNTVNHSIGCLSWRKRIGRFRVENGEQREGPRGSETGFQLCIERKKKKYILSSPTNNTTIVAFTACLRNRKQHIFENTAGRVRTVPKGIVDLMNLPPVSKMSQ